MEDELKHARNYMNIQKIRYKNKFTVEFQVEDAILSCCTVKLVIQPLLENAIYYGMESMDGDGEITVVGYRKGDDVYVEVRDNGLGMPDEMVDALLTENNRVRKHGSGVGLINVHNRIRLRFGEPYGLEIDSCLDEGTTVRIHLPYIAYSPENTELLEGGRLKQLKGNGRMKKNRLYFGMLILMLVAVIIWAFYNMLNVGKQETSYRVSVVVENSNSDRWTSLRQGLEQAARDYNISLSFVSTGSFSTAMEEMDVVKKQVTNGANGIILQMNTDHAGQELEDLSGQTAVLLLETDVDPEGVYALVAPDNEEMGAALAQAVQSDFGDDLAGKRVGILACSQSQRSMQQRYTGVSQGLRESGAVVEWSLEGKAESIKDAFYTLEQDKPVDILIALGNDETEMMVDFFAGDELGWRLDRCSLYGVGSSEKNVYYLDKGWIQTLVVPNEFNMGYQSMEAIAKQLIYHMDTTRKQQGQLSGGRPGTSV